METKIKVNRCAICILVILFLMSITVNCQYDPYLGFGDLSPTSVMSYTTYDDEYEYESDKYDPSSAIKAMRGHEKIWDEEVMFIPELTLEDPNPRNGSMSMPLNMGPCGPTKRGLVYYSGYPGRSNLIRWKVEHPIVEGNCTIRLSNGFSDEFKVLQPVFDFEYINEEGIKEYFSGDIGNYYRKIYRHGKFACGRVDPGIFESITVMFPDYICDECVLQLEVETREGNIFQCADIEIINKDMSDCVGACQNEGVCVNGKCVCRSGFKGDYCQYRTQEKQTYTPVLVIILLILLAIVVAVVCYFVYRYIKNANIFDKETWATTDGKPRKSRRFPDAGLAL